MTLQNLRACLLLTSLELISMMYANRQHAGELLAEKMLDYQVDSPLILAVPRGGVTVAEPVWQALGGELDLTIARKIGAPYQQELAIGAVTADGFIMLNENLVERLNISEEYIAAAKEKEHAEISRRMEAYRGKKSYPVIKNRTVIVIDDGVATGFTLLAALRSIKKEDPAYTFLAVPVGPPETISILEKEVEKLICLTAPRHFSAVGQFYQDFSQVSDEEVVAILKKAWEKE